MPATPSILTITFNSLVSIDQFVSFDWGHNTNATATETFLAYRTKAGEIQMPFDPQLGYLVSGDVAAQLFEQVVQIDWDPFGIWSVSRANNVVTIEFDPGWQVYNDNGSTAASLSINNGTAPTFELNSVTYTAGPSPCASINATFNTTEDVYKYSIYDNIINTVGTPTSSLTINLVRLINYSNIKLYNQNDELIKVSDTIPYIYSGRAIDKNIKVSTVQSPSGGATVTITPSYPGQSTSVPNLILEYSLNGTNYQSSNVFSSQIPGSYTAYVKDQFGCIAEIDFVIDQYVDNVNEIFYISKNNSVTFARAEVWDNQDIMKNDTNVLSESYLSKLNFKEELLFQRKDQITVQLKSNYTNHVVTMEEGCDGPTTNIPIIKKSNNIGRFSSMDCRIYPYKAGYAGLYFISGNTYDEVDNDTGDYVLNGNLPDFAIIGQFVEIIIGGINNGYYEIKDVIYDSEIEKRAIIIQYPYTGLDQEIKVKSTFNLLEYEIYEFTVDFQTFLEDFYRIHINATRTGFSDQDHYSETIYLRDLHPDTLAINYWGEGNSDIFYAYGIKHFIRLKYEEFVALIEDSVDVIKGDNTSALAESDLYDGTKITFDSLTRDCFLKACIALSSPYLFINGVGYIKNAALEYENIENTNLYNLTIQLIKTGNKINEFVENPSVNGPIINVPGVLAGNTGLIKL